MSAQSRGRMKTTTRGKGERYEILVKVHEKRTERQTILARTKSEEKDHLIREKGGA